MKKIVLFSSLAVCIFVVTSTANAEKNTISFGYAQSNVKMKGDKLDEKPKGINIKYRYELDDKLGVIGSTTFTHQGYDYYQGNKKVANGAIDYYSLMVGPSYRFNEYISAYTTIGAAYGKAKLSGFGHSLSQDKTSLAYGAGLQINPMPNWAIDASYEYSKLGDFKAATWVIGLGYQF